MFCLLFNIILKIMELYFIIGFPGRVPSLASDYVMKIFVWANLKMSFHISVFFIFMFICHTFFCPSSSCTSPSPVPFLFLTLPAFSHKQMPGSIFICFIPRHPEECLVCGRHSGHMYWMNEMISPWRFFIRKLSLWERNIAWTKTKSQKEPERI